MTAIKMTVHSTGTGRCALTGRDGSDGLTISFDDGTLQETFLSFRGFRQLLGMKAGQSGRKPVQQPATPAVPATK